VDCKYWRLASVRVILCNAPANSQIKSSPLLSAFALLDLFMFMVKNDNLIHLGANIMLAKLYSNTLLASLNRRGTLTKGEPGALHFSDQMLSSLALRGNHIQEPPSKTGPYSFLSLNKTRVASKKGGGLHPIRVSISTHHYYEGQPD